MALGAKSEDERSLRDDLAAGLKEIEEREASEASAAPEGDDAPAPQAEAKVEPAERMPIVATGAMRMGSSSLSRRKAKQPLQQRFDQRKLIKAPRISKLCSGSPTLPNRQTGRSRLRNRGALTRLRHGKTFPLLRRPPLYAVRRKLQGLPAQMTASACSVASSPRSSARTCRRSSSSGSRRSRRSRRCSTATRSCAPQRRTEARPCPQALLRLRH
jgi:hypothetical protein